MSNGCAMNFDGCKTRSVAHRQRQVVSSGGQNCDCRIALALATRATMRRGRGFKKNRRICFPGQMLKLSLRHNRALTQRRRGELASTSAAYGFMWSCRNRPSLPRNSLQRCRFLDSQS